MDRPPFHESLPRPPARGIFVLTCMDARIDPLPLLGLRRGEAHVARNAGAAITDDVLNSAQVSYGMGSRTAVVVGHTDCGGHADDGASAENARRAAATLVEQGFTATAALYDVATGALTALD